MIIKKKYVFYSKQDKTEEPIGLLEANNLNEAINLFSKTKSLTIDAFLNIYQIKEYDRGVKSNTRQMLFG